MSSNSAGATKREHSGSRRAVLAAFAANLGVAVAKFLGFAVTGAASLLAEGIHSVADCANQALLLLGASRSRRRASAAHPFGYGRERYFWAFVVAVVLFTGGGLFALLEAEEKLRSPHSVASIPWAIGILLAAMLFEGMSLRTAVRRARGCKVDSESWFAFIRRSKQAELTVVLLEDSAALLGLSFALAGLGLAGITGNARFDGLGTLAIGLLLVTIALLLAVEMKSFLIGESASEADISSVRQALQSDRRVDRVQSLRTEQLGPDEIVVGAEIDLRVEELTGPDVPRALRELEDAVREAVPAARIVYVEPVLGPGDAHPPVLSDGTR